MLATVLPSPVNRFLTQHHLWGYLPQPQLLRAPEEPYLALSFDLDYQKDTDAVKPLLALLDDVQAKATFFSIGKLVEADPEPYAAIAQGGHELANHSHTHPDNPVLNPDNEFWDLSVEAMKEEIGRCQDAIEKVCGMRPSGFRSPHFKDQPAMMEALSQFKEISYVSTTLASGNPCHGPYFPTRQHDLGRLSLHMPGDGEDAHSQMMIPLTPCPGLRWSPFSSYVSIRRPANKQAGAGLHDCPTWRKLWRSMLREAKPNRFASVYMDPHDVMRDTETRNTFRTMLHYAHAAGWSIVSLNAVHNAWKNAQ